MQEMPILYRMPQGGGKSTILYREMRKREKNAHIVVPNRRRLALFPKGKAVTIAMVYRRILDHYAKMHGRSYRMLTPFSPMTDFALAKKVFHARYPNMHDITVTRFLKCNAYARANRISNEDFLTLNPEWKIYRDQFDAYPIAKKQYHALDYADLAPTCERILQSGFHAPIGDLYLDDVEDLSSQDLATLNYLLTHIRAAAIESHAPIPDLFSHFQVILHDTPRRLDHAVLSYAFEDTPRPKKSTPSLFLRKMSRRAFYKNYFSEKCLITAKNPLELVALTHIIRIDFSTDFSIPSVWSDLLLLLDALLRDDSRFLKAHVLLGVPKKDLLRAILSGDAVDGLMTDPMLTGYGALARRIDAFRNGKWAKSLQLFSTEIRSYLYTRSRLYRENLHDNLELPKILADMFPSIPTKDAVKKLSQKVTPAAYGVTISNLSAVRGFSFDDVYAIGDEAFYKKALTRAKKRAFYVMVDDF